MNKQPEIEEHLLLKYLLGDADEDLSLAIRAWLEADQANQRQLDRLEALWLETGKLSPAPAAVDVDAAWNRLSKKISANDLQTSVQGNNPKMSSLFSRKNFMAAASVIILMGLTIIFLLTREKAQLHLVSNNSILVDTLPDGTRITLNENSTIDYPEKFSKNIREVKLRGEAFFDVTHDPKRPFLVDAGLAKILVLGTVFNIVTPNEKTLKEQHGGTDTIMLLKVEVLEGRVKLFTVDETTGDTSAVILNAGQTGTIQAGEHVPVKIDSISPDGSFYANRSLDFRSATLREAIAVLEKQYKVIITVSEPGMLNCRFTSMFREESVPGILRIIAETFGWQLEQKGNNYHLSGNGCTAERK